MFLGDYRGCTILFVEVKSYVVFRYYTLIGTNELWIHDMGAVALGENINFEYGGFHSCTIFGYALK